MNNYCKFQWVPTIEKYVAMTVSNKEFFIAVSFVCAKEQKRERQNFTHKINPQSTDRLSKRSPLKSMYKSPCRRGRQDWARKFEGLKMRESKVHSKIEMTVTMHREVGVDKSPRAHYKGLVSYVTSVFYNPEQCETVRRFLRKNGRKKFVLQGIGEHWNKIILAEWHLFPHNLTPKYSIQNFKKRLKVSFSFFWLQL